MPVYPIPELNPHCHCPSPLQQFFCMEGHMTECHAGYNCAAAACSHLSRYDYPPNEVRAMVLAAVDRIRNGHQPPYQIDEQDRVTVKQCRQGGPN